MSVDTRALRSYVVRIDSAAGKICGTGFFAAPGWVLTCAHVVKDAERVALWPEFGGDGGPVMGTVAASSAGPREGMALWPFPDLALVRIEAELEHFCPLLEASDPVDGLDCYAWGYASRERGFAPTGTPASFRFEGVEGDGYLKLKLGQAAPGISGAPLVCPGRRAVVGVLNGSRDVGSDIGGYAAPLRALASGGSGVPGELLSLGREVLRANRLAVVHDRARWNEVLPIDGAADALDRPWADFKRQRRSSPADLLRADFGVVPYLFRDAELRAATDWCEESAPIAIAQVAGRGGAGKTRFAIELCRRMADRGWIAGLWRRGSRVAEVPLPRLVVVDYAEGVDAQALGEELGALQRHATDVAPVRVLLLTRTNSRTVDSPLRALRAASSAALKTVLDASEENEVASVGLSEDQRGVLFERSLARFAEVWHEGSPVACAAGRAAPELSATRYELPLDVLFEALDGALAGGSQAAPDGPPADRVLAHEERYWEVTARRLEGVDAELRRQCVALATFAGARDEQEAHRLLSILPALRDEQALLARERVIDWIARLYDGPERLNALRPDRLGEALIVAVLRGAPDHGEALVRALLALPSDEQAIRCLDVLVRLCAVDETVARTASQALAERLVALGERAMATPRTGAGKWAEADLAGALIRLLAELSEQLADVLARLAPEDPAEQRGLALCLCRLGDVARARWQRADERRLYCLGLARAEALARCEPERTANLRLLIAFQRRLARGAEDWEEIEKWFGRAVATHETIVAREPQSTRAQWELASCSARFAADAYTRSLRRDTAEHLYELAAGRCRELHRMAPDHAGFAIFLGIVLVQWANAIRRHSGADCEPIRQEIMGLLTPLERDGKLSEPGARAERGARILRRARDRNRWNE